MLDQQDFVAALVVNQLVCDLPDDQHAEAARADAAVGAIVAGLETQCGARLRR